MSDEKVTLYYGVWIRGKGWLRGKDNDPFADFSLKKAKQVARLVGNSKVCFIDTSIVDFEHHYLEQEKRTIWHIFKNYFVHKKYN